MKFMLKNIFYYLQNEDGPLIWSEPQQGLVLGSYFWGYLITQVPGGRLAEVYGGKWVFWVAVLINTFAVLLIPVCSMAGYQYLILMRILMGLGAGLTFPAMNVLIGKWAPETERSTISSIVYSGTSLGTVLSIPTSGFLATTVGWESVFYVHGGLAIIWLLLWAILISDCPESNIFLSNDEKMFIVEHHVHCKESEEQDDENDKHIEDEMCTFGNLEMWKVQVGIYQ